MKWLEGMGREGKEGVLKWTNGVREGMGGRGDKGDRERKEINILNISHSVMSGTIMDF